MATLLFAIATLVFIDILVSIMYVGKARPTITGGVAVVSTIINLGIIVVLVIAALHYIGA
jgi:hypothetical protein